MMPQGHFKGIAVVIDDRLDEEADIGEIIQAIRAAGGYVVGLSELPSATTDLENFGSASFFILDWNLHDKELMGVPATPELKKHHNELKRDFLRKLREHRHAPVFIFTNDNVDEVKEALAEDASLYREGNCHILVKRKADVKQGIYDVLNDWAKEVPSVVALKEWERTSRKALNSLFMDLHDRNSYWPVIFWKSYVADTVDPPAELGRLITRLHASRMHTLDIDLLPFLTSLDEHRARDPEAYKASLLKVLEGERFLPAARLEAQTTTGDVFYGKIDGASRKYYWINIRPECDCIDRNGGDPLVYLLKGGVAKSPEVNARHGEVAEKHIEATIFAMHDGKTVNFSFKNLFVLPWSRVKELRVGRLLNPFLARLLQRYAAYSQRPGLPRIPSELLPEVDAAEAEPAGCAVPGE